MGLPKKSMVKFFCYLSRAEPLNNEVLEAINHCRTKLHDLRLIGVNEKSEGFGNISVRHFGNEFIITASQTGKYRVLQPRQFVVVKKCIFENNEVSAAGETLPSSESLSHGAVYESDQRINAVIHVHCLDLWQHLMDGKFVSTPPSAEYGTKDLADAILTLFKETKVYEQKVFAMGGHKEGIIAFGEDILDAEKALLERMRFVL